MPVSLTRPVPANFNDAHIDAQRYRDMYQQSLDNLDSPETSSAANTPASSSTASNS